MATILVVDDDLHSRELYVALLGPQGHKILQAGDGATALKVAKQEPPDLVLCDILMPTMNGYEFVSALRKLPAPLKDIPVIMQSASFLHHETKALGAACGVHDFIRKPCEPEEILEIVNRVLKLPEKPAWAPPLPASTDPLPLLLDAFYEKGQQLDSASVRLGA